MPSTRLLLLLPLLLVGLLACSEDDDPTGPSDSTAPTVDAVSPADGSPAVATSATITVTFSEDVDPESVTDASFQLRRGSTSVGGTRTVDGAEVTFDPSSSLAGETDYTIRMTEEITDMAGNGLEEVVSSTFRTRDVTGPTIASRTPSNGATSVSTGTNITIVFSEAIDASSVTSSTVRLLRGGSSVSAARSTSGSTVTLNPSGSLDESQTYSVQVTAGVRDANGVALSGPSTWSFTTGDFTAPSFVGSSPSNGSVGIDIDAAITVTFDESIAPGSVTNSSFRVTADTWVDGVLRPNLPGNLTVTGNTISYRPTRGRLQEFATTYTVSLTTAITDAAGNSIAARSFDFDSVFLDGDYYYFIKSELRGDGSTLGCYSDTQQATMYDASRNASSTFWYARPYGNRWRLSNAFLGDGQSLESWDGSRLSQLVDTGNFTGQSWSFEFVSGRLTLPDPPGANESPVAYRLRTPAYQGDSRSLTIRPTGFESRYEATMEDDSNYIGNWWYLENAGRR